VPEQICQVFCSARTQEPMFQKILPVNCVLLVVVIFAGLGWADVGGRIVGSATDPSGAVVSGASVVLANTATGVRQTATTEGQGSFSFPVVPVGQYELSIDATGFQPFRRTGLVVDVNSALQFCKSAGIPRLWRYTEASFCQTNSRTCVHASVFLSWINSSSRTSARRSQALGHRG
jgi:hypothetical protein